MALMVLGPEASPILRASYVGELEEVKKLLDDDATMINYMDQACSDWTALHCAAIRGIRNIHMIRML